MNTQRWISFLLFSLSVTLVAMAWVTRPSFCLDSRLVEKLDSVGVSGSESVGSCSKPRGGLFSQALNDLKGEIEPRLRNLERSLDFVGVQTIPLRISIVDSYDPLVRVHPTHLILSRSALASGGVLEKAILLSALAQKRGVEAKDLSADEILWAEVFSDLFLASQTGSFAIQDPILNQELSWQNRQTQWPFVMKTKPFFCQNPWRSFYQIRDCQNGKAADEDLVVSLRPFLGKALFTALETLPAAQRVQWFREVWENWPILQTRKFVFGASVGGSEKQQMAETALAIENWSKNLQFWASRGVSWASLVRPFQKELLQLGFRDEPVSIKADLLVIEGDDEATSRLASLREAALLASGKTIIVIRGNEVRLLPDLKPIPRAWLGEIRARQAVLFQCGIPSVEKLKTLADQAQKLMLIRTCQGDLHLSWSRALRGNIEDFISDNSQFSFIQFHLPSLRSALAKKNLNPIQLLADGQWQSPFFQEIGWEKPRWDVGLKAYRSRAAIEAIESFRLEPVKESKL